MITTEVARFGASQVAGAHYTQCKVHRDPGSTRVDESCKSTGRNAMNVALKEWSSVIAALDRGLQIFVLRKGGLVGGPRGFELRHRGFLLFPTFGPQHARYPKPEYQALAREPENGCRT